MAKITPIIKAICSCGEVLMKDSPEDEPYWTKSESIVNYVKRLIREGKAEHVNIEKCPSCGGDARIKMGSFYHPSFYQKR